MKGIQYKATFAAVGSLLHQALVDKKPKLAEQIYKEATEAFDKLHGKEARLWFENWRTM